MINFVDDSTSIISFNKTCSIKKYLERYFDLLQIFYDINKLKINSDKTIAPKNFPQNLAKWPLQTIRPAIYVGNALTNYNMVQ